jgi:glucan phosphoethanolaminetransferase (alkaline phosphatase superfamily)
MNIKSTKFFALEATLWFLPVAIFLVFYVHFFGMPFEVIWQHLYIVAMLLTWLTLVRILFHRFTRSKDLSFRRLFRNIGLLTYIFVLYVYWLYYGLVIIGLKNWNKVISKELIIIYSRQWKDTFDALQISIPSVLSIFAITAVIFYLLVKHGTQSVDTFVKSNNKDRISTNVLCLSIIGLSYGIAYQPSSNAEAGRVLEPFTMTFNAGEASYQLQDNHLDPVTAKRLDILAEMARNNYQATKLENPKNLILIVVDALRYDKLNMNGYKNKLSTPFLNKLNDQGKVRNAGMVHASCAESYCGMQSLISSSAVSDFSQKPFTLHDVMRKNGYRIDMILGGDHVNFYGMRQLYGDVDSYYDGSFALKENYYVNDDAFVLAKVKLLPGYTRPTMLQFHLMSVHTLGKKNKDFRKFFPAKNYRIDKTNIEDLLEYQNYYDNGVLQADYYIEKILTELSNKGYLQNAVIAITTDHGESLGEHGKFRHANSVYEQLLRIPFFLIDWNGGAAASSFKSTQLPSQIDIAPTVLYDLGIQIPASWHGQPLQNPKNRAISYFQQNTDVGLYDQSEIGIVYKYWFDTVMRKSYVFNVTEDPQELMNLAASIPSTRLKVWQNLTKSGQSTAILSGKK